MTRPDEFRFDPPDGPNPFAALFDVLLDDAEREEQRRAALTEEERAAEDREREEREEQQQRESLARHERTVAIRVDLAKSGGTTVRISEHDRRALREGGYVVDAPEGARAWFQARDDGWYPFETYPHYDETDEIPDAETAPNPIADRFWGGLIDRAIERKVGPFAHRDAPAPTPPPEPEPSREEQIEAIVRDLLARHEAEQRRRAALSPEERAAEDRERQEERERLLVELEDQKRSTVWVRREGEDEVHRFSRADVLGAEFQPLFALRGEGDAYFQANDGGWYRVEAFPEYVRTEALPADQFAAPPWEEERSPFDEALDRYLVIVRERKRRQGVAAGDARAAAGE